MLLISMTVAFESITDPDGPEADEAVQMVTDSCREWALDVGASWAGVDEAWVAHQDELNNVRNESAPTNKET